MNKVVYNIYNKMGIVIGERVSLKAAEAVARTWKSKGYYVKKGKKKLSTSS